MRLIDAESIIHDICTACPREEDCVFRVCEITEAIRKAGTVKPDVVRCADCAIPHNKWTGCPNLNGLVPTPDFYCAKGELKGGERK